MRKLTFLFQLFSKFWENLIWPMKAKSTISAKYFSGRNFKAFVYKLITVCIFHGVTTDFRKTIIWKKVTSITKSREFSRTFDLMIASYNWWKIHTVILRECYHDTMQILLYYGNIMNMFQQKSLELQCKKTISKKEEIIRLHSESLKDFQI